MSGQRQPIELVLAKGSKHLTKKKIEERKSSEVKPVTDDISPPPHLSTKKKRSLTGLLISDLAREILLSKLS